VGTVASEGNLWLHLLLKAYAKISGSYENLLNEKSVFNFIHDLTGFPITTYDFNS